MYDGPRNATSCLCKELEKFSPIVYGVTMPLIISYTFLVIFGLTNLYRFYRVNQLSKSLATIYFWSLLSSICWGVYLSLVMVDNRY